MDDTVSRMGLLSGHCWWRSCNSWGVSGVLVVAGCRGEKRKCWTWPNFSPLLVRSFLSLRSSTQPHGSRSSRSTGEMACDCGGLTRQQKLFILTHSTFNIQQPTANIQQPRLFFFSLLVASFLPAGRPSEGRNDQQSYKLPSFLGPHSVAVCRNTFTLTSIADLTAIKDGHDGWFPSCCCAKAENTNLWHIARKTWGQKSVASFDRPWCPMRRIFPLSYMALQYQPS